MVAPPLQPLLDDDEAFFATNALLLRNPSVVNYLDGCALSLPCQAPDELPVGLMVWAPALQRRHRARRVAGHRARARRPGALGVRIAVIGAGIVGVTSAHELAADGHEVTVYERHAGVASETSFANAGVIAPGYVTPWAAPGMPLKVLRHMFGTPRAGALRRR